MEADPGDVSVVVAYCGHAASWPLPARAELSAVDALARFALAARRAGADLRVVGPGSPLVALIRLAGLDEALRCPAASVEVEGQAEGLEQPMVEEAVVADDPVA